MKKTVAIPLATLLVAMLSGCAVSPSGPSVMALPGSGKSWDQFRFDDSECRSWAQSQIGGGGADQAATDATLRSVAVGTAVGALAGAAMGGERGAGTGAGTGLIVGTVAGTSAAQGSSSGAQHRYDNAYIQCMYAKGNQVPTPGYGTSYRRSPAPAHLGYPPPPPAGYPPPPPPGYSAPPPLTAPAGQPPQR